VPSSTGLSDWRSLVETPLGLFFQGSNGQLWMLPRDSSAPVWIGQPVRDTLVAYPVVTSATLVTEEQLVSFTCNNSGGTDGRIVSYDLRANTWLVDDLNLPLAAACSYQQRLAILSLGAVFLERTSLTPALSFIDHGLVTGDLCPFQGVGWGKHVRTHLVGEYRGDCDLQLRLSYDSGKTWTTHGKLHRLRSSDGYAAGDLVRVSWDPARRKIERVRQEFLAIGPDGDTTPSEGFVFNKWGVEILGDVRGAARMPAAQRG
jgi:hypothetical protein